MEPSRFDDLTKALATSTSRRQALKAIAATLGGVFGLGGISTAFANCKPNGIGCNTSSQCCSGGCCHGTCTNLSTTSNCGACGHTCASGQGCCGGTCTDLTTPQNCGTCGHACGANQTCQNGQCISTCPSLPACNDTCPCDASQCQTCQGGSCVSTCTSEQVCQSGNCCLPTGAIFPFNCGETCCDPAICCSGLGSNTGFVCTCL